jgi:hypothetical protein
LKGGVSVISHVDSDGTEHVNDSVRNGERSGNAEQRDVDQGAVQGEDSRDEQAHDEKEEANKELVVLADGRGKGTASSGLPDLVERGIHEPGGGPVLRANELIGSVKAF